MAQYTRIEVAKVMKETGLVPLFFSNDIKVGKNVLKACYNAFYYNKSSIHGAYEEFFLKFHCYILHRCHNLFGFSF